MGPFIWSVNQANLFSKKNWVAASYDRLLVVKLIAFGSAYIFTISTASIYSWRISEPKGSWICSYSLNMMR